MLDILQAFLAFAVVMLGMATVVTILMETFVRIFRRRRRVLKHMLRLVYEDEIRPYIKEKIEEETNRRTRNDPHLAHDISRWEVARSELGELSGAKKLAKLREVSQLFNELPKAIRQDFEDPAAGFVAHVMVSPLRPDEIGWSGRRASSPIKYLSRLYLWASSANQSEQLSQKEFIRRLARTRVGQVVSDVATQNAEKTINGAGHGKPAAETDDSESVGDAARLRKAEEAALDDIIDRIARRFDETADAAREYFKSSSMVLSMLVGIGIAICFNVEGVRILKHFLNDPKAAEAVAAQAEEALQKNEEARERLDRAILALEEANLSGQPPAVTDDGATTREPPPNPLRDARQALVAAKEGVESAAAYAGKVKAFGVPMGFDYFPHCLWIGRKNDRDKHCDGTNFEAWSNCRTAVQCAAIEEVGEISRRSVFWYLVQNWTESLLWFACVLLTGLVIGLGGPFWYDIVANLTRAVQAIRGRAPGESVQAPAQAEAGGSPAAMPASPEKPSELFRAHVRSPGTA